PRVEVQMGGGGGGEDDDEDVQMVGASEGAFVLADFPHAREWCVVFPHAASGGWSARCPNCYCYVCDVPAAECAQWGAHCSARHADP
ncbi:hypothetical protein T492DRAFT_580753, partial [Pavlovales sp. CCMP2436]